MAGPSATKLLVETRSGKSVEELLRGYRALGWTQQRIADELGVSRVTVNHWMAAIGLTTRRVS